jgi:uncharacterized protein
VAAADLVTGLLANGGGFLLVPLFVLVVGLTMPESAGTSLVVIAVLSIPTLVTHWALGHIDWVVASAFAAGAIPGAVAGSRLVSHLPADQFRKGFGCCSSASPGTSSPSRPSRGRPGGPAGWSPRALPVGRRG